MNMILVTDMIFSMLKIECHLETMKRHTHTLCTCFFRAYVRIHTLFAVSSRDRVFSRNFQANKVV